MAEEHKIFGLKATLDRLGMRVGELNDKMGGAIYVKAEISEFKYKAGINHQYLTLIEKNGDKVEAKVSAHIWKNIAPQLLNKFYKATGQHLEAGMEVAFLVSFDFSPMYGLSFNITDIDTNFTLGKLAQARRETIQRLEDEELIDLNKSLPFPELPNRIAIISSDSAAGYQDFLHKFELHPEYKFYYKLYPASMQGQKAPAEIVAALQAIKKDIEDGAEYDLVAIMRGGGAEIDLVAFDDYSICAEIARFPLPVATGIGHTKDISVADMVANVCKNTPTGLADYLLGIIGESEGRLWECVRELQYVAENRLDDEKTYLDNISDSLEVCSKSYIKDEGYRLKDMCKEVETAITKAFSDERHNLSTLVQSLNSTVKSRLTDEKHRLELLEVQYKVLSPEEMFKRGYTLTFKNGRTARLNDLKEGDKITTLFAGGRADSTINNIELDN